MFKPRRHFIRLALGAGIALAAPQSFAKTALRSERELSFYNLHTGEQAKAAYWHDGQYDPEALATINRILRDHRSGEIFPIDPKLVDILYSLNSAVEGRGAFHVISGYRSATTNAMLHQGSAGVAKKSLHMQGRAIDIRLPGIEINALHQAAVALQAGGVGYYPKSKFIHLDTGRVRRWRG